MEKEICKKIDNCFKINMIRDKDMLDFQFAESVRAVCRKCEEFEAGSKPKKQGGRSNKGGDRFQK